MQKVEYFCDRCGINLSKHKDHEDYCHSPDNKHDLCYECGHKYERMKNLFYDNVNIIVLEED